MKRSLALAALLAACPAAHAGDTYRPGVALRDAVNIRSRPSLEAEVLGQLQQGDPFRAIGEVQTADRAPGEPALWYIIELPAPVRVWLPASRLAESGDTVGSGPAVLHSGPGEHFGKVGELPPAVPVTVLAREGDWVAVRPPPDLHGFVAGNLVGVDAPVSRIAPSPAPSPPTVPPVAAAAPPAPPPATTPATTAAATAATAPATPPAPEPAPLSAGPSEIRRLLDEAGPPRIVRREGRLARAWNIQAPGHFLLRDVRTGRVMNFLHGERFEDRRWRDMVGRVVVVEGREFLDARWPRLPVLEAERVELIR